MFRISIKSRCRFVQHIRASSKFSTKLERREIPQSLLRRQELRLKDGNNLAESPDLMKSLEDVFKIFNPNHATDEDDDILRASHDAIVNRFVHSKQMTSLLKNKFGFNEGTKLLDLQALTKNFNTLSQLEHDCVMTLAFPSQNTDQTTESWNELPPHVKQLQFYIAYGPYGPRQRIPFNENMLAVKNVPPRKGDPVTKFTLYLCALISAIALWKDKLSPQKEKAIPPAINN
ncbi:uncharacterized protein KNAG_0F02580 [Huiozyma naganishii CBS 8797]|uniref:Genetic interactor of prohibitin 7, mitochondrial n=1 Tax=Huiozyma naganishii (strain ATCC MYA-139 / BCRC 22969 / CBS 8797 / KCTC 17520 / NBRC 10181 / NCYC 3082 / Yp74L-3) TaxID=1071383 RepID=J7RMY7_HUIN7|nr:hypothetical protein KNAG_0F02580 [Kazachstania naganishii CBS 8797]CCK70923.1 hypothetical protein KNAG_0F02580 [Kazachstania naganishii CBS 8797]